MYFPFLGVNMKIFYFEKEQKSVKLLKKQILICFESLMLVFVMSVFCVLFVLQKTKMQEVDSSATQVSSNIVFELIELEIEEKTDQPEKEIKEIDFWQIFEEKQKENNG